MKEVDVAIEITVKTICGPNLNLRPDLFIDLSTFTPCRITFIQHISTEIAGPLFTSQGYPPLVTILIMSQKLWFDGDVIRKTLVGILEEDGSDESFTDETHSAEGYDEDENEECDDY